MSQCPYCGGDHLVSRCPQACPTCHGGQEIFVHSEEGQQAVTLHASPDTGTHQRHIHLAAMTCPTCHGTGVQQPQQHPGH